MGYDVNHPLIVGVPRHASTPAVDTSRPFPKSSKEHYHNVLHDDIAMRKEAREFVMKHWWKMLSASGKHEKFKGQLFTDDMVNKDGNVDSGLPVYNRLIYTVCLGYLNIKYKYPATHPRAWTARFTLHRATSTAIVLFSNLKDGKMRFAMMAPAAGWFPHNSLDILSRGPYADETIAPISNDLEFNRSNEIQCDPTIPPVAPREHARSVASTSITASSADQDSFEKTLSVEETLGFYSGSGSCPGEHADKDLGEELRGYGEQIPDMEDVLAEDEEFTVEDDADYAWARKQESADKIKGISLAGPTKHSWFLWAKKVMRR